MNFDTDEKIAYFSNLIKISKENLIKQLDDNQLISFYKLEKLQQLFFEENKEREFCKGIAVGIKIKESEN